MLVVKVIELMGCSPKSFDDAIKQALKRACKTLRGVSGAKVLSQNVVVKNDKIVEYRVDLNVAFRLENKAKKAKIKKK